VKWLCGLIVAALCLAPVGAGAWWQSVVQQSVGAAPITFSLVYQSDASDTAGGTTINYGSLGIGAADTNRAVIICLWTRAGTSVSSATIGGVSATQVAGTTAANGTTTLSDMWQADVPTGTTATISVTYSVATQRSALYVYRLVSATRARSDGQNAKSTAAVTTVTTTTSIPTGGVGINCGGQRNTVAIPTWTNATQDASLGLSGAHGTTAATTNGTGSVAVTMTGQNGAEFALSSASWGP